RIGGSNIAQISAGLITISMRLASRDQSRGSRSMRRLYSGVLLSALWAAPAAADTAMFSFPAPTTGASTERGTDGFRFTPNVDLEVTALGYYDHNQDGFTSAFHPVAIYDFVTRAQLVKVSVQSTSPLDGLLRY